MTQNILWQVRGEEHTVQWLFASHRGLINCTLDSYGQSTIWLVETTLAVAGTNAAYSL